jgi:hypothetical protein
VTGYRLLADLAPNPHGTGSVTQVVWDRESANPAMQHICAEVVVKDEGVLVRDGTLGICKADGGSMIPPPPPTFAPQRLFP